MAKRDVYFEYDNMVERLLGNVWISPCVLPVISVVVNYCSF